MNGFKECTNLGERQNITVFLYLNQNHFLNKMCFAKKMSIKMVLHRYIKLTIAHVYAAEDSHLLSKMQISLTVQKWIESLSFILFKVFIKEHFGGY